jgi:predicted amidophosphoribosyltransferase
MTPPPGVVVTWAPTAPARRRSRGYDQAELLAVAVARRWGLPCRALLGRRGRGPEAGRAQTGASAAARRRGPSLVARSPVPGPVVVVDDVTTTGATLRAAAEALRAGGAPWVAGLTAASTPRRLPAGPPSWHSVLTASPSVDQSLKSRARPAENKR